VATVACAVAVLVGLPACSRPNYWSGGDEPFGGAGMDARVGTGGGSDAGTGGADGRGAGSGGTGGGAGSVDGGGVGMVGAPDDAGTPSADGPGAAPDLPPSRPDAPARDSGAPPTPDAAPDRPLGWSGKQGHLQMPETGSFDLGSGKLSWSIAGGQQGYFYSGSGYTTPEATIASVSPVSRCDPMYPGYAGLASVQELRDAASLTYSVARPNVRFGSRKDPCNMGLLVFKQNGRYGVIDFLSVEPGTELAFDYWLADPGVTDFSDAPCAAGKNRCGGVCTADSVSACGPSCRRCAAPTGGSASCDSGQCTFCNAGFRHCGGECVQVGQPCP
jgi:hypothetical protein